MASISGISLPKVVQPHNFNLRQKVGVITRRPTQNLSFARKKPQDLFLVDIKIPSKQKSREKTRSEIGGVQQQRSLEQFKSSVLQNMKFLSPKHETQFKVLNSFQAINKEKSPRFCRKNQFELRKSASNSVLKNNQISKPEDIFGNCISEISFQSFINKSEVLQTQPQTMDEIYDTSRQILELREQNLNLKHQIQIYKVKCDYLEEKLAKNESQSRKSAIFVKQCNFCTLLEQQIIKNGRHRGILEIQIAQKDKEIGKLAKQLKAQKDRFQKINNKYLQQQKQLQNIQNKEMKEQKIKQQLYHIINSLNQELGNTTDQMRYLKIQQNVLLKKKHQSEKFKAESAKLFSQNQTLKKVVTSYKEKLEVFHKIHNKKASKQRSKEFYYEDLFQLSSEYSIDER